MRAAAPTREALATAFESGWRRVRDRRLRTGNERRQAIDTIGDHGLRLRLWLWLRLVLRLRARLAVFARLSLVTWFAVLALFTGLLMVALKGLLTVALTLVVAMAVAHVRLLLLRWLLLHRHKAGLLAKIREILAVVVHIVHG